MPDKIKRRITIIVLFILLAAVLLLLPLFSKEPETIPPSDIESSSANEDILTLRLYENELCLFQNRKVLKKYDVNPAVLPGEDVKQLSDGINVASVAEADTIAEDYDG